MAGTAARDGPTLRELNDAVLAVAAELDVDSMLARIAHAARDLAGARYAAVGVPDGEGGFARFVTAGMSDALVDAIGPLPRTHGLLAATLAGRGASVIGDLASDERFEGFPAHHPHMASFLGVPVVQGEAVTGAIYVTDKAGGFTSGDVEVVRLLAAHAAVAIRNASLLEAGREAGAIAERNRLARDLHDAVSQTLFSAVYVAEAAVAAPSPQRAEQVRDLTRRALDQMRGLIFELRPADIASDGLAATLRKHADVVSRVHGVHVQVDVRGDAAVSGDAEVAVFRIATEALANAVRHSGADAVRIELELGEQVLLRVADDGGGFDPGDVSHRARRLGLTSMEERAHGAGGRLVIRSAPGEGTAVTAELPA